MTELASNFTTISLIFFVHTNFLNFSFKFADKEEAAGYSRRLFYHIDSIVVERKTESW